MAERSIVPKTHLLKSIRSRTGQNLDAALHEFCDNSIGHGQATTVYITVDRDRIVVRDDGIGCDDVARLFTLGDASGYGKLSEIGQYGIGATDSAIFLGNKLEVITVREGRVQRGTIDWEKLEDSGEWKMRDERGAFSPDELATDFPTAQGTKVTVSRLNRRWSTASSARLAEHLGLVFMPALRTGTRLHVTHMDRGGVKLKEWIAPYTPPALHDEIPIAGAFDTGKGRISWSGRAGLSPDLSSRENAVLVIFGHRVIERTDDPFQGKSAPTLYAELELCEGDGAKYLLSDKKDKIVRYRDELMESIHAALADLIEKAREEGQHLALASISLPIQEKLTKALQGSGVVFVDPNEEGELPGDGRGPVRAGTGRVKPVRDEGEAAKERPPTGVQIEWWWLEQLNRMPYDTTFSACSVTVKLAREYYDGIIEWPPKQRDQRIVELIVGFVARGIENAYETGDRSVLRALKPKLQRRVEEWAASHEIAPRLQAELQARITRADTASRT